MYDVILSFITAFTLTFFAIPSIINVARVKNLVDVPTERHSHTEITPSLGGIGIFAGVIFSIVMWTPFGVFGDLQYILASFVIIFLMGAKDDILPMSPYKKMVGQLFAAFILVYKANIKITSLYGIFGIFALPESVAIILSVFTIFIIVNAFNLIDGINGLAGCIAVLISLTFGTWFLLVDRMDMAMVAFSLIGATVAFLNYNFNPAKIFMGDTGSLLLGLICSILAIKFIEYNGDPRMIELYPNLVVSSTPAVAIGILILPLFDTLRVFTTRMLKGKSPFYPDKTHIHHLMLDCGMSHMQGTLVLVLVNIAFIALVYFLQDIGSFSLILLLLTIASISSGLLYLYTRKARMARFRTQAAKS